MPDAHLVHDGDGSDVGMGTESGHHIHLLQCCAADDVSCLLGLRTRGDIGNDMNRMIYDSNARARASCFADAQHVSQLNQLLSVHV